MTTTPPPNPNYEDAKPSPEEDGYYFNFKHSIRAYDTDLSYHSKVHAFMRFKGIPPRQGEYHKLVEGKDEKQITKDIIAFIVWLKDNNRSYGTQKAYLTALMKFYKQNYLIPNRSMIGSYMSSPDDDGQQQLQDADYGTKPYAHEQISRLLDEADTRAKVMILLMCSSGMRVGALCFAPDPKDKTKYLKCDDLTPVPEHNLYQIHVYAYSKSDHYYTFCTPECRKWIDEYLNWRRRCGEEITAKSPLLRTEFDSRYPILVKSPKPLSRYTVKKAITKVLYQSGLRTALLPPTKERVNSRREVPMTNGFRRFFDTNCGISGMFPTWNERCMGHKLPGSKDPYTQLRPDSNGIYRDLLEGHDKSPGYLDSIDWLTIDNSKRLQRENEMLKVKKSEYEALKQELHDFKQAVDYDNLDKMARMVDELNKRFGFT